jgi:hypothetical protein
MPLNSDNHYVPQLYLKRFTTSPGRILTYSILVAHSNVPEWRLKSIKGIAYRSHLYTRLLAGVETDEVEKWLNDEFETPAEEAIRKATSGMRLTQVDWRNLIRYLAAQDVRTPARLIENLQMWQKTLPGVIKDTLKESIRTLELAKKTGEVTQQTKTPHSEYIPMRVTSQIEPGQEFGQLKSEVIAGRGLWLFSIRHSLANTINALLNNRWSILTPPGEIEWFTSDDPVIKLNYYSENKYDFKGGWGNPGTEIFLPLDSRHLLYTQVGQRPPLRGHVVSISKAKLIRRFIAEHAHRSIFATSADCEVPSLHPRTIDAAILRDEHEQWRRWHEEQTKAEMDIAIKNNP